jgi:hypothetical protein
LSVIVTYSVPPLFSSRTYARNDVMMRRSVGMLATLKIRVSSMLLMCAAATQVACSSSTAPVVNDGVVALSRSSKVEVTNGRARPLFTFAVGRNAAALADWAPCVDAVRCPPIEPGRTRQLTYLGGSSESPEREVILYWWHAVPGPNGVRPDSIRAMIVRL